MRSVKTKARQWARNANRRRDFRPEFLESRDAALWARMRLDDIKAARETADQQKCLREIGGGLVWPEAPEYVRLPKKGVDKEDHPWRQPNYSPKYGMFWGSGVKEVATAKTSRLKRRKGRQVWVTKHVVKLPG